MTEQTIHFFSTRLDEQVPVLSTCKHFMLLHWHHISTQVKKKRTEKEGRNAKTESALVGSDPLVRALSRYNCTHVGSVVFLALDCTWPRGRRSRSIQVLTSLIVPGRQR